jgi:MFS family permease
MIGNDKDQRARFNQLIIFYAFFVWFVSFSKAVLPTHFLDEGLSLQQILLGVALGFVSQLIILFALPLFIKKISSRLSWQIAIVSFLAYVFLVIKFNFAFQFYVASFIGGFATSFFYIFYNIAHFKLTPKEKVGHSSAIMFNIGPIVSIAAPLLAGILASQSYYFIWVLVAIFFAGSFFLSRKQYDFKVNYNVRDALREIEATRIFMFLQGVWEVMVFGIIPVYTLFFIKNPLSYGTYLAYLSVIAVFANLFLGKFSDKIQRRSFFLYPITLLMAVLTFLFPFTTQNIILWIIITGALQLVMPIFWNFSTALVIDAHKNVEYAMIVRELMLTIGRVSGILLALLSFSFERYPFYIFIVLGIVILAYPFNLFWRTKIAKSYSYL